MHTKFLQNLKEFAETQTLDREWNINYIWDNYKSVHGVRPSWLDFNSMTNVEIQDMATNLKTQIKESIRQDEIREYEANEEFEEAIALCLSSGAKTRKQAIRWLFASLNDPHIFNYFITDLCYLFGISYEVYCRELKTIFPKVRSRDRLYFKF